MKQLCQLILCQIGSDHAQASGVIRPAFPHLILSRHQVKLLPGTVRHTEDSFGPEYRAAAGFSGQCLQDLLQFFFCVLMGSFSTPAGKNLVRMVMMMVMTAVFMIMVFMVVMAVLMIVVFMVMTAMFMIMVLMVVV